MDELKFNFKYVDVGDHLNKIIFDKINNFTFCEIIIISVLQWLTENKYDNI